VGLPSILRGEIMKAWLFALVMAIALSGCATTKWGKNGDTNVDASQDEAQCDYQTSAAVANMPNMFESAFAKHDLMVRCMRARGYQLYRAQD
jgi:hypothetical protein